jgi:Xaa-Pro dipeptidase
MEATPPSAGPEGQPQSTRRQLLAASAAGALLGSCSAPSGAAAEGALPDPPAAEPPPAATPRDRSDELLSELSDPGPPLEPIQPHERAARRRRLGELLAAAGVDAWLCEAGPTMTYLAGVDWGRSERLFALVVLADGSHFWTCPAFEAERARLRLDASLDPDHPGGEIVAWDEDEYAWAPLQAALRARGAERVAVDPQTRLFIATGLASRLGAERVLDGRALLVELRGRKDAHELALLRRANELTQRAIVAVSELVEPGMSGSDVARLMGRAHRRLGMTSPWCLALVGPAAAYPHGQELDRTIERGDLLLVDTGAAYHDYCSDNTRTWCVAGQPDAEQLRAWNAVHDAQQRAFEAIRPGALARDVDAAARRSIEAAGYPGGYEVFSHRLGHGIGLEGHEDPYFDGSSEVVLRSGMTLSNEPGIYLLGRFGVRIEDIVAVTEDGAEHFGSWQRGPSSPA